MSVLRKVIIVNNFVLTMLVTINVHALRDGLKVKLILVRLLVSVLHYTFVLFIILCIAIGTCNSNNGLGTCNGISHAIACSYNGGTFCYCENGYYIDQQCIGIITAIHPFFFLSIHPSILSSIHSFIHPSIHSFIHLSIHPFFHPFIHSFFHPSIHPSI